MALAPRDVVFAVVVSLVIGGVWNLLDRVLAGLVAASAGATN